jgi:hypothetical protein
VGFFAGDIGTYSGATIAGRLNRQTKALKSRTRTVKFFVSVQKKNLSVLFRFLVQFPVQILAS